MQMARFILAESSVQFDRPTMAIGGLTSIVCSTLRGMSGECSARPTSSSSSTETIEVACCWKRHAMSNWCWIAPPCDIGLHWYGKMWIAGKSRKKALGERFPCKLLLSTCMVSVFDVPGFPTMKSGSKLSTQMHVTNRFSESASFIAMPSSTSMWRTKRFCTWESTDAHRPSCASPEKPDWSNSTARLFACAAERAESMPYPTSTLASTRSHAPTRRLANPKPSRVPLSAPSNADQYAFRAAE